MKTINKLISDYLINSYIYYVLGTSVISDQEFDDITQELKNRFDEIKKCNHPHKKLVEKTSLEANTGFHLINKFPKVVQLCGKDILEEYNVDKDDEIYYCENEIKNINDLF